MFEPDHIFHAGESRLPRVIDRTEDGSKNGLRSDLSASNLKNFSLLGVEGPTSCCVLYACCYVLGRTNSILLPPSLSDNAKQSIQTLTCICGENVWRITKSNSNSEHTKRVLLIQLILLILIPAFRIAKMSGTHYSVLTNIQVKCHSLTTLISIMLAMSATRCLRFWKISETNSCVTDSGIPLSLSFLEMFFFMWTIQRAMLCQQASDACMWSVWHGTHTV